MDNPNFRYLWTVFQNSFSTFNLTLNFISSMKKTILLLAFSCLLFARCKVTKYTPDKLPERQLIFGDGGGFAGIETSFTLLENGQIFKQVGLGGNYEELKPIKRNEAKQIYEKASTLQLFKLDIDKPGNLYYFLREINEQIDSKVTWGAGDYLPPQSVVFLYKDLAALVKDREVVGSGKKTFTTEEEKEKQEKKKQDELGW